MLRHTLALTCAVLTAFTASAKDRDFIMPDLPSADMRISWPDFVHLLEMVQEAERPGEAQEKAPPPWDWAIPAAHYDVDATTPGAARVEATFDVQVWSEEWVTLPILGRQAALASATLDGEPTVLKEENAWFSLAIDEPGMHALKLVYHLPTEEKEGDVSFQFTAAPTTVTQLTLRLDKAMSRVASPGAASVVQRQDEDALVADLVLRSAEEVQVQWRRPAKAAPEKPVAPREKPRVACQVETLVTVTDNVLACRSHLHYDILRGSVGSFALYLPKVVNVLGVVGKGAEWSAETEGDRQHIAANVNHAIENEYDLQLAYELPLAKDARSASVPVLEAVDVVRQTGNVAVASPGNIEVDAAQTVEGATRIDASELPARLHAVATHPILHAFKYTAAPYLLDLDVRRLDDVPVRVASIDGAKITSVLTEEGMLVTRAVYEVRNNLRQFLRVDVGEDAEVWSAMVKGEAVRPARDGDSAEVLLPLAKSVEQGAHVGAFPVELVYASQLDAPEGLSAVLDLACPATDILANGVVWELFVPESRRLYHATGDFKPVRFAAQRPLPGRGAISWGEQQQLAQLREGIERFFVTDVNNPAAAPMAARDRYKGAKLEPEAAERLDALGYAGGAAAGVSRRVAGVLPVSISLPTSGRRHVFQRSILPAGENGALVVRTCDARLGKALGLLAGGAAFVAGWLLIVALMRIVYRRAGATPVCVLILLLGGLTWGAAAWDTLGPRSALLLAVAGLLLAALRAVLALRAPRAMEAA